jgi:serine/threonine-protein kinase
MAGEVKKEIALEIAHVLFLDIVGYSRLLINEQRELLEELNQIVRDTEAFRAAEAAGKLIRLPTGDGMALVFSSTPESPVQCALEISRALKSRPELPVRMGVHSGPVSGITDVNDRTNVAGAGINMAQRVMDCGDGGHILLSKRVAEDLAQYRQWQSHLHDLGECDVKHDMRVSVVNLYTDELGNAQVPEKLKALQERKQEVAPPVVPTGARGARVPWHEIVIALLLIAAVIAGAYLYLHRSSSGEKIAAPASASPVAAMPEKSVAVLPFENLSRDPDNAFFTDGVQDQILTALSKLADLKVISRTSVMQYKTGQPRNLREIAQQLGVTHVLEGSVQRAGNKVRVNAQLINAHTDAHEWAENYDRPIDDVFAIQSEIAKAIADQLQARISPNEKAAIEKPATTDLAAFDLFNRARSLILTTSFGGTSGPNLRQAVELLEQALVRDPSFFLAQCQLANTHGYLYFLGIDHTPERLAAAKAAVDAAVRLQPDAGEAHLARAELLYRGYLDYNGALTELALARKTLPNDPRVFELTGYIERRRGHAQEGLRNLQRAAELDPRNFFILQQIALSDFSLRRYADAAVVLDRALTIKPDDVDTKLVRASIALDEKAHTQPLHQALAEIRAQGPEAIAKVADSWLLCALAERDATAAEAALVALGDNAFGGNAVLLHSDFGEGLIARMTKDAAHAQAAFTRARAAQEKIVAQQPDYGPPLCVLGLIDAGLGRKEEALREGRRAMGLVPVEKDAFNGAQMIECFALIAAWVGEKDLACEYLAKAISLPAGSFDSYGALKLLPYWDPLRGESCFEKIVTSLAPKESPAPR